MNRVYTAVTKQDNGWWIGWIEEVPGVNCQERTHEQLLETLKVTLKEALDFNRRDAISALGTDFREEQIAIWKGRSYFGIFALKDVNLSEKVQDIPGGIIHR
jgi:predicted RNase H-like HicB family nuclease